MKVADAMTRGVLMVSASQTVRDAATIMAREDVGFLPVEDEDRLVGTITDRDIVVRCIAESENCDTPVTQAMTRGIKYCFADEEMDHVVANMGDIQVRRLPCWTATNVWSASSRSPMPRSFTPRSRLAPRWAASCRREACTRATGRAARLPEAGGSRQLGEVTSLGELR